MVARNRRRRIHPGEGTSNTGQMMNLSLFIMLLAFFIVLNAISSFIEDKSKAVRESVTMAFNTNPTLREEMPSEREDETKSVNKGDAFDRLEALFEAQIAAFEVTRSKSMGVMMVEVPLEEFTRAVMAIGQSDLTRYPNRQQMRKNAFLPTLISIMRSDINGAPTRVEILLHTKENPAKMQNLMPTQTQEKVKEAANLSRQLEKSGMPQKLVNIGLQEGDPAMVNLLFRKFVPYSPVEETDTDKNSPLTGGAS